MIKNISTKINISISGNSRNSSVIVLLKSISSPLPSLLNLAITFLDTTNFVVPEPRKERVLLSCLGHCSIFGINMKGLYIMVFCALIVLSLITLTEAEGHSVGINPGTQLYRERREAAEEVTKRGWFRKKRKRGWFRKKRRRNRGRFRKFLKKVTNTIKDIGTVVGTAVTVGTLLG
ncbi:hypothetical protein PoB_002631600 [Plakobranchus ocellatus]|uniref:Uncharacterized protein n=1 Tax=Plakobranchus ocellatus TaxID=259542 RepID=A0AAV3ZV39_9GAST|nr:hypothetical protein PoB_002631600 [Plakobranchus ocellatus]